MAILNDGLFGKVNGKIKNLVIYERNGQMIIQSIGKNLVPASIPQLAVRKRVAVVTDFLKFTKPVIDLGYEFLAKASEKNPHNEASSYHTKNATKGEYPDITMDYSKVMFSQGSLEKPINPIAIKQTTGIEFRWDVSERMSWGIIDDRTMILLYYPLINQAINIVSGERRSKGTDFVAVPETLLNMPVEIYIAFSASDNKSVSDSVYLGSF